ncbi:hypothetical protein FNF27_05790 [Cafeteria roenbergensis]|uniref:Uncharacterized protein n=1 Tax=Cafeteria roenbergensis TaxID=33653 RepID=A0A5A8E9L5_CAFRO|nr:hypothetical protein FNF27_05790 [Cafeteria roenbergensis]
MASAAAGAGGYVYIMRHSERQDDGFCEEGSFAHLRETGGHNTDIPITRRGIVLAERAAARLLRECSERGCTIEVVVSSPYLRCIQTSLVVAKLLGKDAVVVDARLREFHSPGDQTVPEKEDVLPRSAGGTCEWRERLPAAVDWTRFDRQTEATSSRGFFRTVRSLAECSGHALEAITESCGPPGSAALLVTHAEILYNLESTVHGGEDDDALDPEYTCISCVQRAAGGGWDIHFSADSEHIDEVPEAARGSPESYGFPADMRPWPAGSGPRGGSTTCSSA